MKPYQKIGQFKNGQEVIIGSIVINELPLKPYWKIGQFKNEQKCIN
jgi:hypothetical protein